MSHLVMNSNNSMREDTKKGITYDAKYLSWLKINHPEADLTIYPSSLLDHFTDVGVLAPVSVCEENVSLPNSDTTVIDNPSIKEVNISNAESHTSELSPKQLSGHTSTNKPYQKRLKLQLTTQANAISKYLA